MVSFFLLLLSTCLINIHFGFLMMMMMIQLLYSCVPLNHSEIIIRQTNNHQAALLLLLSLLLLLLLSFQLFTIVFFPGRQQQQQQQCLFIYINGFYDDEYRARCVWLFSFLFFFSRIQFETHTDKRNHFENLNPQSFDDSDNE